MTGKPNLDSIRRALCLAEALVPWVALVAAAVGVTIVLRTQRQALAGVDWTISWEVAATAAAAFALAPLVQGLSFALALRMLTGTTPLGEAMVVWSRSYVVRYAPTGAIAIAYRVAARQRMHASAEQVLAAYGYEHVATLAAGAAACLLLYGVAGGIPPLPALSISVAALAATVAVRPGALGKLVDGLGRRVGLHVSAVLPPSRLAALVALNGIGWLGTGTGVYVIVSAVAGDSPSFLWLVGTYTAGYLVGFVAPLAPGGLGAREGMLVVLLRGRYGFGPAAAISLAIRVVNVAGELLAVASVHAVYVAALAWGRLRRRPREVAGAVAA